MQEKTEINVFYLYREVLRHKYHCHVNNDRSDQFPVIRKTLYDEVKAELDKLKQDYNDLSLEYEQFRTRCPIPNTELASENIRLRQFNDGFKRSVKELLFHIKDTISGFGGSDGYASINLLLERINTYTKERLDE